MRQDAPRGPGMILVISGPSGVGKTTITMRVRERLPDAIFSVSATTRSAGRNEVDGRDYHFLSESEFDRWVAEGLFLEHAIYAGNKYGTPRRPVEEQVAAGRVIILDIDVQGGRQVKRAAPESFSIFIEPPSEEALLERLRRRGREDEEAIQRRFREAKREIAEAKASGAYDLFIVNDDLDRATAAVLEAVATERSRRGAG
jgi:guanylate kinase